MKTYNLEKAGTRLPELNESTLYRCVDWSSNKEYYQTWGKYDDRNYLISVGLCRYNEEIHVSAIVKNQSIGVVFMFKLSQIIELIENQ